MKVIPISCRCKLSALVPHVRQHLVPAPRPTTVQAHAPVVRPLFLPPAA